MCLHRHVNPRWFTDLIPYGEAWNLVWEPSIVRAVSKSLAHFLANFVTDQLVRGLVPADVSSPQLCMPANVYPDIPVFALSSLFTHAFHTPPPIR